jgi:hypothetical protein
MGPRLKLPKYVHGFLDRHGVPRFYYRRPGFAAVKLPGLPYSPEFMASYTSAIGGQSLPVGAAKVMPGTMRAGRSAILPRLRSAACGHRRSASTAPSSSDFARITAKSAQRCYSASTSLG